MFVTSKNATDLALPIEVYSDAGLEVSFPWKFRKINIAYTLSYNNGMSFIEKFGAYSIR